MAIDPKSKTDFRKSILQVAMISTFNYHDGIEDYTNELIKHLEDNGIKIKRISISRNIFKLTKNIFNTNISLIHLQHEYSYFWFRPFGLSVILLLIFLRLARKKIIITLHTVYPFSLFEKFIPSMYLKYPKFIILLAKIGFLVTTKLMSIFSNKIVVLTPMGEYFLKNEYKISNVVFIPYGLHSLPRVDPNYAKTKLNLQGKIVLMCFGYPYPNKGFQYAIDALDIITKKYKYNNIILLLQDIEPLHKCEQCKIYINFLKKLVSLKKLQTFIRFLSFIPEDQLPLYLSAVDIFIYPYEYRLASSSALMKTLSLNKIYIVSDIPTFSFLKYFGFTNIIFVKPKSSEDIALAISKILHDRTLSNYSNTKIHILDWNFIANLHKMIYLQYSET